MNRRSYRCGLMQCSRAAGLFLCLAAVLLFLHIVTISEETRRLSDLCVGIPAVKRPEASRVDGYCNHVNTIDADSEDGNELACLVEKGEYDLVQVIGLYRHGQRTPIYPMRQLYEASKFECHLPNADKWTGLDDVLLKSFVTDVKTGRKVENRVTFSLNPGTRHVRCKTGALTRAGFEQLSELGDHFRRRYIDSAVVKSGSLNKAGNGFRIYSTAVSRCMRSAAAFINGLHVGPSMSVVTNDDAMFRPLSRLFFPNLFSGVDVHCSHKMPLLHKAIHEDSQYMGRAELELEPVMKSFSNILGIPRQHLPEIVKICDNLQLELCVNTTGLYCQDEGHCITSPLLRHALSACDTAFSMNYTKQYSRLLAYPLLRQIIAHMETRIAQTDDNEHVPNDDALFVVFFGHETTLLPVLVSLDLFDETWPPLASRLLFELWRCRLPNCPLHKVRILYNGRAVQGILTDTQGFVDLPTLQKRVAAMEAYFVRECSV